MYVSAIDEPMELFVPPSKNTDTAVVWVQECRSFFTPWHRVLLVKKHSTSVSAPINNHSRYGLRHTRNTVFKTRDDFGLYWALNRRRPDYRCVNTCCSHRSEHVESAVPRRYESISLSRGHVACTHETIQQRVLRRKLTNCGLTDEDFGDLAACFDSAGRGAIESV